MAETDWYEVVQGAELLQGDVLIGCPILAVMGLKTWPLPQQAALNVEARVLDVVVLTQSCDLANDKVEVHPFIRKELPPRPVEFDVPKDATRAGALRLTWYQEPGRGGNGRGCQVSEVWLIRK